MRSEFEAMINRNNEMLRGYSMSLTGNRDDAQDLYQDTMFRAFRGIQSFRPGTNEGGWLYTIMRNTFINRFRSKRNSERAVEPVEMERLCAPIEPESLFDRNGLHDEVALAIEKLPKAQREVLFLREFEDLDYEEIAERAKIPVGTVRSRLNRGRSYLGDSLKEYAASLGYGTRRSAIQTQEC